jgi:hypothetical protein
VTLRFKSKADRWSLSLMGMFWGLIVLGGFMAEGIVGGAVASVFALVMGGVVYRQVRDPDRCHQ